MINLIARSFLLKHFQNYYIEVLKFKEQALIEPEKINQEEIKNVLIRLLKDQKELFDNEGSLMSNAYEEYSYICCAFADEIFINVNWNQKKEWQKSLMEQKFFSTYYAGSKIFENINSFLKRNSHNKYELGSIYITLLGSGFRGQYRSINDNGTIHKLKQDLFDFVNKTSYDYLSDEHLFPQAEKHNMIGRPRNTYKNTRRIISIMTMGILIYIGSTYILWNYFTHDINSAISKTSEMHLMKKKIMNARINKEESSDQNSCSANNRKLNLINNTFNWSKS
ncbi:DotU family type IV/VI secretion system protein [Candidatus Nesciobacter abundans]|uniref:DotU family type IV/VI secretion system protein n=1 Tax=Candidatus Nesciobacter abundans TaxID=2601668 RepID=A0A5C0UHN8_9PROT|nr:DotU family type IV/VI secretion system protein [Candidatus Nesciobacter abundans]QEK38862.1 DotU family type IV/VI secretion system protein [Candidatus Nesciobacter abundans]